VDIYVKIAILMHVISILFSLIYTEIRIQLLWFCYEKKLRLHENKYGAKNLWGGGSIHKKYCQNFKFVQKKVGIYKKLKSISALCFIEQYILDKFLSLSDMFLKFSLGFVQ